MVTQVIGLKNNKIFFESLSTQVKDKIVQTVYDELNNVIVDLKEKNGANLEITQPITCENNYNLYQCYTVIKSEKKEYLRDFDYIQERSVPLNEDQSLWLDYKVILQRYDDKTKVEIYTYIPSRYD